MGDGIEYELTRVRLSDGWETTVYLVRHPLATTSPRVVWFPEPQRLDHWCAAHGHSEAIVAGFFVRDPADVSTPDLIRAIARALGRPARLVPVPAPLFRAAGAIGDLLAPWVKVPVSSLAVARLLGSLAVDDSKLARVTGFEPPYPLVEGLRITAEWYRRRPAGRG